MTSLIQAERYGTPLGQSLRVLAQENRDQRMIAAEKKAAALPPKLTVPMILFFLPVLFGRHHRPGRDPVIMRISWPALRQTISRRSLGESRRFADGLRRRELVAVGRLQLLPGVLLGEHRLEIGDVGRRLVRRELGARRSSPPRRSVPAGRRRAQGSGGPGCRRWASAIAWRRMRSRLRRVRRSARRTCRSWTGSTARSARDRAPGRRACAPRRWSPIWSRIAASAEISCQSGWSGVCARRMISSARLRSPSAASALP